MAPRRHRKPHYHCQQLCDTRHRTETARCSNWTEAGATVEIGIYRGMRVIHEYPIMCDAPRTRFGC